MWSSSNRVESNRKLSSSSLPSSYIFTETRESTTESEKKKKKNPGRFIFSLNGLLILQLFCSIEPVISYLVLPKLGGT